MTSANRYSPLFAQQRQLTTDDVSADPISSPPPSVGSAQPPTTPGSQSSEPRTPPSTGYPPSSDSPMAYSPPKAAALLPGAPMTVDLMILTEYLTSQFLRAGNSGNLPSHAERIAMQDFLINGDYGREDMEAGFLHAVSIVCKARTAFNAALAEVAASEQADVVGKVEFREEAQGFRAAFSQDLTAWEDVDAETVRGLQMVHLHRGVLQAYGAVAELKVGIVEVYKRQAEAEKEAKMEMDAEESGDEGAEEDASSISAEAGSVDGKNDDTMEVDSAYGA